MTRPAPADLLAIARATLLAEVVPDLSGRARFAALMAASAMAIAERALRLPPAEPLDDKALCAAIRAGGHDDDAALAARLLAAAEAECRISAPRALDAAGA